VATLAIPGAWFGLRAYRVQAIKASLAEAIGRDSGYTETILKVEADSSQMTYLELFQLCDKSIEDRTQLIVSLRGLYPEIQYEVKDRLIAFLNSENELVRSKRALYRHQMELATNLNQMKDLTRDTPSSSYAREYWLKRASEVRENSLETVSKLMAAAQEFGEAYGGLASQEGELAEAMEAEGIRFRRIFDEFKESNIRAASQARESATSVRTMVESL
jgi:hypothetical protein